MTYMYHCCGRAVHHYCNPPWTTTPPTEPGWYWVFGWCDPPEPVYVIIDGEFIAVLGGERMTENMLSNVTHWLRIEEPEVPK